MFIIIVYFVSMIIVRLFYFVTNNKHQHEALDVGDWCAVLIPWVNTVFAFTIVLCILIMAIILLYSCVCELRVK